MEETEKLEDAISNLPKLLTSRLKEIEAREKDLEAREAALRQVVDGAEPSDVLELNVGGQTNIAVLRKTLTLIEGSVLAAKYSGRWDESLEKDSSGRIFIDADPELFNQLLDYLRQRSMQSPKRVASSPLASESFDRLLDFYGMTLGVYPIEIKQLTEDVSEAPSTISGYPRFSVSTTTFQTFELEASGHDRKVKSYQVTLGRFSRLQLGYHCKHNAPKPPPQTEGVGAYSYSVAFNATNQTLVGSNSTQISNIASVNEGSVIECNYDIGSRLCLWKVGGVEVGSFTANSTLHDPAPCISIHGDIDINEIEYADAE